MTGNTETVRTNEVDGNSLSDNNLLIQRHIMNQSESIDKKEHCNDRLVLEDIKELKAKVNRIRDYFDPEGYVWQLLGFMECTIDHLTPYAEDDVKWRRGRSKR